MDPGAVNRSAQSPASPSSVRSADKRGGEWLTRVQAEAKRVKGPPTLVLEQYAGTYADSANGSLTVAVESGKLVVRYGPEFTGDLEHWHYDTFRVTWRVPARTSTLATFRLDRRGAPAGVSIAGFPELIRR